MNQSMTINPTTIARTATTTGTTTSTTTSTTTTTDMTTTPTTSKTSTTKPMTTTAKFRTPYLPSEPETDETRAIKARQQATWSSGNFSAIGTSLQITGELLCEAVEIEAGWHVLDVAAGNGNAALAAAARNAIVTASDYVPALLDDAAARADASGLRLSIREADAEALPFGDDSFDAVLSTFGVMFAPRQRQAASELARVCRPGGRLGLVSWTPNSFVAEIFKTVASYVPPAPVPSVFDWGRARCVAELFGPDVELNRATTRDFVFRYKSAQHFVDTFRAYYGPTHRAFATLDEVGQAALASDLIELASQWNRSSGASLAVPSEYLEVVATKR